MVSNRQHFSRVVARLEFLVEVKILHLALPSAGAFVGEIVQVGGPVIKAIENMRSVNDGSTTLFGLPIEPLEQVLSDADIEACCNLVKEKDFEGSD